ncbi:MAG: hypothetical protein IPN34_20625 [Planctomycetes bacterium]|nr:hypothetical protein [Planctomycetota bacterium]
MPYRVSKGRVLGAVIAVAALLGGTIASSSWRASRTRFELASELASNWERALEDRLASIYGAGAIDVAVLVELDDARRELEREDLDPSTAVPLQKANGVTSYEASRTRERLEERSPRLLVCRATLRAAPQLALPSGVTDRRPTESEREALEQELLALTRASLPLCTAPEDPRPAFELVLRASPQLAPEPASTTTPVLFWPLALGLLLFCGAAVELLRRHRQRRASRLAAAARPHGLERARAAAARHPRHAARVLEAWCSVEARELDSPVALDGRSAALLLAELGGGLSTAVLSALRPATARRLALLLEARPVRLELRELAELAERFAAAIEEEARHRELAVEEFVELAKAAIAAPECAALEKSVASVSALRRAQALLAALPPAELAARLAALAPGVAESSAAALPPELAAQALAELDATQRAAWLERIARVPAPTESERETLLLRLAAAEISTPRDRRERSAECAARIAARWPHAERDAALQELENCAPDLAPSVREQLIAFEDLAHLEPEELRTLLGCLELGELALALRGAPEALASAIERALTPRVRERLREERANASASAEPGARAARARLVAALRELFERGEVELRSQPTTEVLAS